MVIAHYRYLQIIGLVLVLVAGQLWSQRLAEQNWRDHSYLLEEALNDQLDVVEAKIQTQDDPVALVRLGQKFLNGGDARSAVIPLERAARLKPNYRDAWYLLGYSYIKADLDAAANPAPAGRPAYRQQAKKALEKARSLDPTHAPTNQLLKELGK